MPFNRILLTLLLGPIGLVSVAHAEAGVALFYDDSVRPATFAAAEIRRAQVAAGGSLQELALDDFPDSTAALRLAIAAGVDQSRDLASSLGVRELGDASPQAYSIRRSESGGVTTIAVLGADPAGAMYGGLDIAEAIRLGTLDELTDSDHQPYLEKRGIKFNIPLDARTPSYSDNSDAAQNNIPEMWSFDFWQSFIDEMARHRFNALTLWNLHPFPSLVKVPEFPDVALDDVKRTTFPMDDSYSHSGSDMVRPELLANLETVKKMSIDEKIQFWRDVMQYAQDRGVEVYFFTWNIFTFGAEGNYGITPEQDNPKTIEYFRASLRELVLTYPLLAGFGITAGEQMERRDDEYSKEKWLWAAYGEGIRDALEQQPGRDFRLIHRYHQTAQSEIVDAWKDYPSTFDLSFKYAIAHMYSVPDPPYIHEALPYLSPELRTWLTVRDDDYYTFRWGDPEFARAFIRNMPGSDKVVGYYMGPDGYTWGREFLSTEPESPRELVIEKRWYSFMLWGRLSYDPELPDTLFRQTLAYRFPEVDAGKLDAAWRAASKILPQTTRFFWGDIDLRWFPEACMSHPRWRGFYTVKHFIERATMPGSGILGIMEWRQRKLSGEAMDGVTPIQVADNLEEYAGETLRLVRELRPHESGNKELRLTLGDLEAMAYLGQYYADKIRGAADLALYDKTGEVAQQSAAIAHLRRALAHWVRYASAYTKQYEQPKLYNRVGWIDIPGLKEEVARDVEIATLWTPGTIKEDALDRSGADTPFRK